MLDAGVDLRDVQIAARHADPRTTMRCDRARKDLDRHPNCIPAAYMPPAPRSPGRAEIRSLVDLREGIVGRHTNSSSWRPPRMWLYGLDRTNMRLARRAPT
jgi:hypothetical protein